MDLNYLNVNTSIVNNKKDNIKRYLSFDIDNVSFITENKNCFLILTDKEITKIYDFPGKSNILMGLINYLGNIIPIVDISNKKNINFENKKEKFNCLILGSNNNYLGIIIKNLPKNILLDESFSIIEKNSISINEEKKEMTKKIYQNMNSNIFYFEIKEMEELIKVLNLEEENYE